MKKIAEQVMKVLRNSNFNKIQISSATDKEQQIQKFNSILERRTEYEENNGKR